MDRNWNLIIFNSSEVAHGEHQKFIARVNQIYQSSNKPNDFALFQKKNYVPEDWWIGFLTPVAAQHCKSLCKEYTHCLSWEKPALGEDELSWIAGDEESWSV
ncbi:MAG: hypothetical protein AUG51_17820 [Acidobacteria bacterium 13_1_20CM_3_53_8]|nr:MAG: hypothetical protein AUG51_17820 [Acidobacteria bacterium 13_1_20CM_3_53_8]